MMTIGMVRKYALSLPETTEQEHFGMPSFRVRKKIFSTIWEKDNRMMVKLSPVEQSVFCSIDSLNFSPVPGGWGAKGATFVELATVGEEIFIDALTTAYCNTAPTKLAQAFRLKDHDY